MAAALAWASGLRLYLALFLTGLAARYGWVDLPPHLELLQHNAVLAASGFMLAVEFFTDKVPWIDSVWDGVHTFIRIPGGAILAAQMMGDTSEAAFWAAAIIGGSIAALVHGAKASSRAAMNVSPEPFSNWAASFTEDALVFGGLWTALVHPVVFLAALIAFLALAAGLVWLLWGFARSRFFTRKPASP